jgi:G:T-mismatch repair DNA endonuclease (very short patch repair protein)
MFCNIDNELLNLEDNPKVSLKYVLPKLRREVERDAKNGRVSC